MKKRTISFFYGLETKTHEFMTRLRERLWYEADVNGIKKNSLSAM